MGRMRIKKKGEVTPLAQTLPYRMLLVLATGVALIVCAFEAFAVYRAEGFTPDAMKWTAAAAIAAASMVYNIERVKHARISPTTLKRMKRR
jgi:hypothetical protein